MEAQAVKDGFKETKIGSIPEDWRVDSLGNLVEIRGSRQVASLPRIAVIPMELIPNDRLYVSYNLVDPTQVKSMVYCEKGDILLPKITPCVENGKQGIVPNVPNEIARATTEVFPLKCKQNVDPLFLFFLLKEAKFRNVLINSMTGTTGRQRVPKDVVLNLMVPFPPFPEQQKIVSVFLKIQHAIEHQDRIIGTTRNLKKSLMKKLFSEGIGHTEFKDSEIGQIPENWEVAKLGDVIYLAQYGLSIKGGKQGQYPIVRMSNLEDGHIVSDDLQYVDVDEGTFERFRLTKGNILFNRTNSIDLVGKTSIFDRDSNFVFASYLIRLKVRDEKGIPKFVNHYLNWEESQRRLKGLATRAVGQSNISATRLRTFVIPLPPISEQQEIANALSKVDAKIEGEEKRKVILQQLFKTMLHKMMCGEIRVKDLEVPVRV